MQTNPILMICCYVLAILGACHKPAAMEANHWGTDGTAFVRSTARDIDILLVVDNSGTMEEEQELLRMHFPLMIQEFRKATGSLPNIHLGVITSDLGLENHTMPGCSPNGDQGLFKKGANDSCVNPQNQHFLVDVEPKGCNVIRQWNSEGVRCPAHDCRPENCSPEAFRLPDGSFPEPDGLVLMEDDDGCPRCRNYTGETLEKAFSCIARQGFRGCGIEQPLEAMYQALTTGDPRNQGFLRPHAFLAVLFLSDEDDCSLRYPPLYPPTDVYCLNYSMVCDQDFMSNEHAGNIVDFTNCRVPDSPSTPGPLFSLDRYTELLRNLREPDRLMVAAMVGRFAGTIRMNYSGCIERETVYFCASSMPVCEDKSSWPLMHRVFAAPRIRAFVERLSSAEDLHWKAADFCKRDFLNVWSGFGSRIGQQTRCFSGPVAGCPDPAFAFGLEPLTNLPPRHASICSPDCTVQEQGPGGETRDIFPCDPSYLEGRPPEWDPQLPVEACHYIRYNPACAVPCPDGAEKQGCHPEENPWHAPSRGAELVVSRRGTVSPGMRLQAQCKGFPLRETDCLDGIDNDLDGRVDQDDPDCQDRANAL